MHSWRSLYAQLVRTCPSSLVAALPSRLVRPSAFQCCSKHAVSKQDIDGLKLQTSKHDGVAHGWQHIKTQSTICWQSCEQRARLSDLPYCRTSCRCPEIVPFEIDMLPQRVSSHKTVGCFIQQQQAVWSELASSRACLQASHWRSATATVPRAQGRCPAQTTKPVLSASRPTCSLRTPSGAVQT